MQQPQHDTSTALTPAEYRLGLRLVAACYGELAVPPVKGTTEDMLRYCRLLCELQHLTRCLGDDDPRAARWALGDLTTRLELLEAQRGS